MVQANPELLAVQDLFQDGRVAEIPKHYIVPHDKTPVVFESGKSVPVVDLHDMNLTEEQHRQAVQEMAKASYEWGFFQVINHGIDVKFLEKVQEVSRGFFELPREEKVKYTAKKFGFQEDGYGSKVFTAEDALQLWRDFLMLCLLPMEARNTDNWPAQPAEYIETISRLSDEFLLLAQRLLGFLSEGLGLPTSYIQEKFGEPTLSVLTNFYPACPEPDKVLGFMPHSDFGGLTLLLQDGTPGLQVLKDDTWVMVEPLPGAITVNISDLLELMSNGRYKSVTHRVQVSGTKARMSIASNYSCSFDGTIAPAPELIDEEHPQLYKPVVFGDYVAVVAKQGPTGKAYMFVEQEEAAQEEKEKLPSPSS